MVVPKIPSQDEYYEAYYNTHRSGIASMRTIECKQDLAQALVKILKDLRREDPTTWDATQQGGKTLDQAKAEILLELQGHDYVILDIEDKILVRKNEASKAALKQRNDDMTAMEQSKVQHQYRS
jgi:hypothetical protein